jgi:hypothetical protein
LAAPGPLAVLVHDRIEAEAALALAASSGIEVALVMEAGMAGPAFVRALETLLDRPIVALCDDRPGLALAALRAGLSRLVLEPGGEPGASAAASRLADMAAQLGCELSLAAPAPLYTVASNGRKFMLPERLESVTS